MIYLFAFLGGLILNFMPCVLPVLGLKLLSKPSWSYVAGIMSVFMALATLCAFAGFAWGEQFNSPIFSIGLIGVVFAFALSLFGVWELPASWSGDVSGPFWKGVLATVLATPCSGPLLGSVFAFTLGKPPLVVYSLFACIGAGMSAPYVAAMFLRVPLPKPGAWMETFKVLMGFALTGTCVWLLSAVSDRFLFPTLATLVVVGAVCWSRRWWLAPLVFLPFLAVPTDELPWQTYQHSTFEQLRAEGRPVMVDFTASWCATCQTNKRFVLNTAAVKRSVLQQNVVPLKADIAEPQAREKLEELGFAAVPVLVIFKGDELIVLPDLISQQQVIEALSVRRE